MGKKKDRNQELEQHSRGRLQTLFSRWVVNSLEEDYAFDFEVRPTESQPGSTVVTSSPFFVQLKASNRFDDPDSVWWDLKSDFVLNDCLRASVPVVLLIYERWNDEFYWCVLQDYCWDVLDTQRNGWREQSTVRVTIARNSLSGKLAQLNSEVGATRRRLSLREYIATSQRSMLEMRPETAFASTDAVAAYKAERFDEAMEFVEAGRAERALTKLMQVYQMPEEDEPTAETIGQLLHLRETDEPGVAFEKVRLARDGFRITEAYERNDLQEQFKTTLEEAWDYLEETFIGAKYRHRSTGRELLIVDIEEWGSPDGVWIALVQYDVGEFGDEHAQAIAEDDQYVLIESGESRTPHDQACAERNHVFDEEALRNLPAFATCADCNLSYDTLDQWLSHEVPSICDQCGCVAYDVVFENDRPHCTDCS
ncbi:DUF4365 domain-containing protein [Natronosalvus vescus]|uniref:DUF4365 domain-containing protein n=1 Tax=Natronosalvus vescus TaxID=2953881 RepID=UPI00209198CA|nr:DUF4365 domain-containing protein [Natronosalvus vescus]